MQRRVLLAVMLLATILVLLVGHHASSAFTTTVSPFVHPHRHHAAAGVQQHHQVLKKTSGYTTSQNSLLLLSTTPSRRTCIGAPSPSSSSTHLSAAALSSLVSALAKTSPVIQAAIVFLTIAVAVAVKKRRAYLFQTDPTVAAPLPDGKYGGCPLFGSNVISKSTKTGLSEFYSRASAAIGNPGVFKCLAFGQRMVVVSGAKLVKQVLSSEFSPKGGVNTGSGLENSMLVTGKHSILYSQQEKEHNYLRRLIGQAMTPEAITRAIPTLEDVITKSLDEMVQKTDAATASSSTDKNQKKSKVTFVMENVCTDFTLDVAHSQILGLDLHYNEEIIEFRQRVNDWIWGAFSPRVMFLPFTKQSKAYKARVYLVDKITRKIQKLRATGKDDGSTLSAMVFAKDEESQQRLTDIEIIDNALLLILAGSETSASTLTNVILFLGLHPEMYRKVQEEQQAVIAQNNGSAEITRAILDKEMPYLEAVIKETMRIRPIDSGALRIPKETIVLDGKQVPKGVPIVVNIQLTHELDPLVSEPNRQHMDVFKGFKPERWLDPETRPSAAYMPFGFGPRYCLGVTLAMAEMKLFLALFARRVQRFDLVSRQEKNEKNEDNAIVWKSFSIIPKPADGSEITIEPFSSTTIPQKNTTVVLDGVLA